ncbi:1665_t:CDS:1, partial [Racocetra persica]
HNFENDEPSYKSTDYILNDKGEVYKDDRSEKPLLQNDSDPSFDSIL